jgi:hypothetical protein
MNHRILLNWATIPTFASSMLTMVLMPVLTHAAETRMPASVQTSCNVPVDSGISLLERRLAFQNGETNAASSTESLIEEPLMDFSTAESDAAVALFGCDCPPCINALRQVRSQLSSQVLLSSSQILPSNSQGHCWKALQLHTSPQEVQDILQNLATEETNQ